MDAQKPVYSVMSMFEKRECETCCLSTHWFPPPFDHRESGRAAWMLQVWRVTSKLLHSLPSEVALRLKYKWDLKDSFPPPPQWLHQSSMFPGLMEKWWKFLHYVQLDLDKENNFKRKMLHPPPFSLSALTLIFLSPQFLILS